MGFTEDDKTSWCNKLIKCKGDTSYTLCQNLCEVGDVYYSDGTCGLVEDYIPNNQNKIPVGVVFYVTDNGYHGKILNLYDLSIDSNYKFNPENPYHNNTNRLIFGLASYNNPNLKDLEFEKELLQNRSPEFYDGAKSTEVLIHTTQPNCAYAPDTKEYRLECVASAALAAHSFYPPELESSHNLFGQGKWYLPAAGELMDVYGTNNDEITEVFGNSGAKGDVVQKLNQTLRLLASKNVQTKLLATDYDEYYWSSSESSTCCTLHVSFFTGRRGHDGKKSTRGYPVRVVTVF